MNDDQLEKQLTALRPARIPAQLQARLAPPPPAAPRAQMSWRLMAATFAPLAAAACWWLLAPSTVVVEQAPAPRPAPAREVAADYRVFHPVKESSKLVAVHDLPILNPGSPNPTGLRVMQWVDDTIYQGEDSRTTLRQRQPRAQVIPVSFETY